MQHTQHLPKPSTVHIVDDAIVFAVKEADDFGVTTFDESAFIKTEEVWARGGKVILYQPYRAG